MCSFLLFLPFLACSSSTLALVLLMHDLPLYLDFLIYLLSLFLFIWMENNNSLEFYQFETFELMMCLYVRGKRKYLGVFTLQLVCSMFSHWSSTSSGLFFSLYPYWSPFVIHLQSVLYNTFKNLPLLASSFSTTHVKVLHHSCFLVLMYLSFLHLPFIFLLLFQSGMQFVLLFPAEWDLWE